MLSQTSFGLALCPDLSQQNKSWISTDQIVFQESLAGCSPLSTSAFGLFQIWLDPPITNLYKDSCGISFSELSKKRSRLLGRISHESNNENAPSDPRANLLPFIVLAPENSVVARWGYRIFRGCRTNEAIVSVYSHSRHADFIVALADHIWDAKWIFPVAWCLPCSQSEGWGQQDGERLGRRAPLSHADKCRQPWVAAAATAW